MIHVFSDNFQVLFQHFVINAEHAKWKMLLYRRKKSTMVRQILKMIGTKRDRPLIVGIGDANFASTGKGERTAPTKSVPRKIWETMIAE